MSDFSTFAVRCRKLIVGSNVVLHRVNFSILLFLWSVAEQYGLRVSNLQLSQMKGAIRCHVSKMKLLWETNATLFRDGDACVKKEPHNSTPLSLLRGSSVCSIQSVFICIPQPCYDSLSLPGTCLQGIVGC